jgi:hypothetical protein
MTELTSRDFVPRPDGHQSWWSAVSYFERTETGRTPALRIRARVTHPSPGASVPPSDLDPAPGCAVALLPTEKIG